MKAPIAVTFRPHLVSSSVQFLGEEDMSCIITQEGIPDLVGQLLYYKEEGKPLYPEVYVIDDLDLVKAVLPSSQFHFIGSGEKDKLTMLKALKKCAPLTENGWSIYILRKVDSFEFGVFRAGLSLISVSISEHLIDYGSSDLKVILIRQIAEKLIEVKGVTAHPLLINFGNRENVTDSPISNQMKFVETIVSQLPGGRLKESSISFFRKVFMEVLQKGHGTLACVVSQAKKDLPKKLNDGILLQERINIPMIIEELLDNDDLQANSKLEGQFSLIVGMMQSDGITVFTDKGEVAAYNVFVKHPQKLINTKTTGGARSRTFLTLCEFIGNGIESAYIQSQDGKIEFKNGN